MRQTLTTDAVLAIPTQNARILNLALLSGEVIYRIGDDQFNATTDLKLTEDVRTDSLEILAPTTVYVKAIAASEIQFRRE